MFTKLIRLFILSLFATAGMLTVPALAEVTDETVNGGTAQILVALNDDDDGSDDDGPDDDGSDDDGSDDDGSDDDESDDDDDD